MSDQILVQVIDPDGVLTKKGRKYLEYTAKGYSAEQMAEEEHRSLATAKSNLADLKRRLDAGNGPSLIAIAVARGILNISLVKTVLAVATVATVWAATIGQAFDARIASQRIRNRDEVEAVS